jgi:hypothetical protein
MDSSHDKKKLATEHLGNMTFPELYFPKFIFMVYFEHLDFDQATEMSTYGSIRIHITASDR